MSFLDDEKLNTNDTPAEGKVELDDLCLKYLEPEVYYDLSQQIHIKLEQREKYIADIVKEIIDHYFAGCYQMRNEWMVDRSNLVIAVFNGQKGGTKNTVDYAKRKSIKVVNVLDSI